MLVAQVGRTPATRDIKLPATTRGFDETEIYAKVPGYIKSILVDKGDHVHAGELLALIESPETDQQVRNAQAAYRIAKLTDDRNQILVRQAVISQQIADESHATMMQAKGDARSVGRAADLRTGDRAVRRNRDGAQRRSRPFDSRGDQLDRPSRTPS